MMISKCSQYCVRSPSHNWGSLNSTLEKLSFRADLALVNDQTACDNSQVCGPWIMVVWEWLVYLGGRSLSLSTPPPSALTSDLTVRPTQREMDTLPLSDYFPFACWMQALSQLGPTVVLDGACTWPFHPSKPGVIPDCLHRRLMSGSIAETMFYWRAAGK